MAKNTSIVLGNHFDSFIQSEIQSGRYNSISEVIRSGLRMFEDEKSKITAINKALEDGEESGEPRTFDNEKFKMKLRKKLNFNE
ncbi:type II toxin-antitoxin system ParD family antitoxin [Cryomorpha ignava]|uniref:Type II toxin-antitoxin system ParD family antitoxin n=1 Tax=Cryomorpha ignava TaxID=101383 RepID=A0A7K3WTY9_9FLAO|nr:type II toxin-antitoxin system ParD family antitoxin [Cryomorpha ignava]NEN24964.1 type II toxin-antitoxin system ParD family antitoxin [Cryomorpha ignava]